MQALEQKTILGLCVFLTLIIGLPAKAETDLMPIPAEYKYLSGKFRLNEFFSPAILGHTDARLNRAVTRMMTRLSARTGFFFTAANFNFRPGSENPSIIIKCKRTGKLILQEDESYFLSVTGRKIELNAETDIGILRGLETLLQLLKADETGYYFPSIQIKDSPRFPWRGLLIDPGRHFLPVEVIKRNLDGMASVKLNVLHWHLTEDQGFRIESKRFPKLHELGSDGHYYSQAQVKEIIAYAADRGIRVMPEFDLPGHTTSWLVAYPEYAAASGPYKIERTWGVKNPVFDPSNENIYQFFSDFFEEMAQLFPDEYMHIGGDENNGIHWNASAAIQDFMRISNLPDNHALQNYFNRRILTILSRLNKRMMGWDEIFQPGLPQDVLIQSWRGKKALVESAEKGYRTILSNGYYIDLIHTAKEHYLNDPLPGDTPLSEQDKKLILGGEATMWGEYVGPQTIDSRIWPRTAAIAERLWSPETIRNVDDMYRRLDKINLLLEEHGLLHIKNYAFMLRRLTGSSDIKALKILVDVIEPLEGYKRGRFKNHTSYSPLIRVVDAARPESKTAREFRLQVDTYLRKNKSEPEMHRKIKSQLRLWQKNHSKLQKNIKNSPILKEIESLSQDLSRAAGIGLAALEYITGHQPASSVWINTQQKILKEMHRQRGQTELIILPSIEQLVTAGKKYASSDPLNKT